MNPKYKIYLYGVAAIVVLIILYKITKGIGRLGARRRETKEERGEAEAELRTTDLFNPLYYKDIAHAPLGEGVAKNRAITLRKSMAFLGTREEKLFGVFAGLKNKINISEISEAYYKKYKRDLRADILKELTKKEQVELLEIINALPNF